MTRLVILAVLLAACIAAAATIIADAARAAPPPHRLAPPVICTWENRMDIFIDEDNIMYACECEALIKGVTCRWQVIGGVDAPTARRYRRRHPRASVAHAAPLIWVGWHA